MFLDVSKMRIFVRPGATDMRKQARGLSVLVEQEMELNVFGESLFVFCNRRRNLLKILYWDRNGLCQWQKRLEQHRFPWPMSEESVQEIREPQLRWLLEGIDFWKAHTVLEYTRVS